MRVAVTAWLLALAVSGCDTVPLYPTNDPDDLPSKEEAAEYFERVTEGYSYVAGDAEQRRHVMGKVYRLLRLRSVVATSDDALTRRVDDWLVSTACDLAFACVNDERRCPWETKVAGVDRAVASGWARVRPLWKAWLDAKAVSFRPSEEDRLAECAFSPMAAPIPELDRYAFGFRILDEWEVAGRPGARSGIEGKALLPDDGSGLPARFSEVVAARWEPHRRHASGNPGFYRFGMQDPYRRAHFLRGLLALHDPLLVDKAMAAADDETVIESLRDFEQDAEAWTALFAAFAKTAVPSSELDLEMKRLSIAYPSRKETLMKYPSSKPPDAAPRR
jgi:hypothetical protein